MQEKKIQPWSIAFFAILSVFVIVKTYFSVTQNTDWNRQPVFMAMVFTFLALVLGLILVKKDSLKEAIPLKQSPILGSLCVVLALLNLLNFWLSVSETISKADIWNNKLMFFIKVVFSCATFIVMAMCFFGGKNFFESCEVLAFGVIFYQIVTILSTLTLENHNPEIYDVLAKSCLLLFSLYHINNFLAVSEKSMTKTIIFFGYGAVLFTFMVEIPKIAINIQNGLVISTSLVTAVFNIVFCLYVAIFLSQTHKIYSAVQQNPVA